MKEYIIKNSDVCKTVTVDLLSDGKNLFGIFFTPGVCEIYTAGGHLYKTERRNPDRDAVAVNLSGTSEEREMAAKAARARAAGRETVRAIEEKAYALLEKGDAMTAADRRALLSCVNVARHNSGKIEGAYSLDGSAGCAFCMRMRAAAADEPLIICGGCYAAADAYKEFSWRRHSLNARILSEILFTPEELGMLPIPADVELRINEDGDTVNAIHARNVLRVIEIFRARGCRPGYWFKNTPAVEEGLRAEGVTGNAEKIRRYGRCFTQSSILIGFRARPVWFADRTFTVYPDEKTTADAIRSGAWPCNGRKCKECKWHCYPDDAETGTDAAEIPDTAELLRCGKAARAEYLKAYNARKALFPED